MLETQNAHKFVKHLTIYGSFYLQLLDGGWQSNIHIKYVYHSVSQSESVCVLIHVR